MFRIAAVFLIFPTPLIATTPIKMYVHMYVHTYIRLCRYTISSEGAIAVLDPSVRAIDVSNACCCVSA